MSIQCLEFNQLPALHAVWDVALIPSWGRHFSSLRHRRYSCIVEVDDGVDMVAIIFLGLDPPDMGVLGVIMDIME
jgi:hypothetical protein